MLHCGLNLEILEGIQLLVSLVDKSLERRFSGVAEDDNDDSGDDANKQENEVLGPHGATAEHVVPASESVLSISRRQKTSSHMAHTRCSEGRAKTGNYAIPDSQSAVITFTFSKASAGLSPSRDRQDEEKPNKYLFSLDCAEKVRAFVPMPYLNGIPFLVIIGQIFLCVLVIVHHVASDSANNGSSGSGKEPSSSSGAGTSKSSTSSSSKDKDGSSEVGSNGGSKTADPNSPVASLTMRDVSFILVRYPFLLRPLPGRALSYRPSPSDYVALVDDTGLPATKFELNESE
ncbi:unnamed protein product [Cyprideis torosa]|uniref:Uncharacterized protein n=1 Tax=Cyprideis torosa TaxID=163714 RepID=A0A7R8W810_9CRUS|nr:unnamed protein product [Cyprideis torosa]CAG0888105.1 unnamed protein product [Cyprideis torosa]